MILNTNSKKLAAVVLACAALLVLFIATNPEDLPLVLLTLPFLLLFLSLFLSLEILLSSLMPKINAKSKRWLAVILAGLPVLLVLLQSIGQLSVRDLLLVIALVSALIFYFKKADFL